MRGHLGSMQIAQQTFSKIVLAEFSSSRVQGDMSEVNTCVEPAAHVRDDPVLHSLADRLPYFPILERSGVSQRRLAVFGGIAPPEYCLETMHCACREAALCLVTGTDILAHPPARCDAYPRHTPVYFPTPTALPKQ